mgnify:CR=1 FL=1
MLWRNQELWLLGGGVLALLVCILVPHIWISALVLAGWLGISAIFVWKIYRRHQEEQERQERIQKRMQERMKKEIQAERERSAKREKLLEEKYHEEDELAQREKELNLEFEKQMWNQERIRSGEQRKTGYFKTIWKRASRNCRKRMNRAEVSRKNSMRYVWRL